MARSQEVILTNMCMVRDTDGRLLVQIRNDKSYGGAIFPGGHVEAGESITASVIREVYEETGIEVKNPKLCGLKHFYTSDGIRYLVFLYKSEEFSGEARSSTEGDVMWVNRDELLRMRTVRGFAELMQAYESDEIPELWYHDGTYSLI